VIVLDEHLSDPRLLAALRRWYRSVRTIKELRAGTTIKDDAVPRLLHRVHGCTFVTINHDDFWRQIETDRRYCVICLQMPHERIGDIPGILRRLFRLPEFRSKRARCGKVIRVSETIVQYYTQLGGPIQDVRWA
jgi:hypothetical protein